MRLKQEFLSGIINIKCPMPVKTDVHVPPPANSHQPGVTRSLLYNGSRFQGHQKSKGNCYDVEVVLQVTALPHLDVALGENLLWFTTEPLLICNTSIFVQHVDEENSYLCGYLKIKGLTEEFPTLTTFFDGEIISKRFPFLTRKWDADEDVDKKHWVIVLLSKFTSKFIVIIHLFAEQVCFILPVCQNF